MAYYLNPINTGLRQVNNQGDGYSVSLNWFQAYPKNKQNKIAYNIYFSTEKENVYLEGPKYVSIDDSLDANIIDLIPGQVYYFSIRPIEYDPLFFNLSNMLPVAHDNLRVYPYSLLKYDLSNSDLLISLVDISDFPQVGVVKIGAELIKYLSLDTYNKQLVLTNIQQRGIENTTIRSHKINGFDGLYNWDPKVVFFIPTEETIYDNIYMCQIKFEYPNFASTILDGYHQISKDLLTTDLTISDEFNSDFPMYDYAGYHRTDPVQLLNGTCVGSYIGGEMGCIDGYGNVNTLRGMSLQTHNNQRQELLLSVTGRPAILVQRVHTGITCSCFRINQEYPDNRCVFCLGTKFILGYEQYFNPRRSDGKILVRAGAAEENLKMQEAGLESEFTTELWTLTVPTIKTRDIIIMFDMDGNEDFRYEVLGVTRNNTILSLQGGQKMRVQRIRKTDPAYQVRIFQDTSLFPSKLNTSIGMATNIPPHTHEVIISEKVLSVTQINQITSFMQSHSHEVVNGQIMPALGHSHTIII